MIELLRKKSPSFQLAHVNELIQINYFIFRILFSHYLSLLSNQTRPRSLVLDCLPQQTLTKQRNKEINKKKKGKNTCHSFDPTISYKRAKMAEHVVIGSFPNCVGTLFKDRNLGK